MQMIDVGGGRRVAFACSGEGSPAVVLETGLGAESSEWAMVVRDTQEFTRVCRCDRAGRGTSDPPPTPRSALDMIDDLHRLLRAAEFPGPYVLVGHSFGGLLMRLYAARHGSDVVGLVLVDSLHEDQFDIFGGMFPLPAPTDPPALREARAYWSGGWRSVESTAERIDLVSSISQGRQVMSLGELPVHVITAGTFLNQPLVPAARREELQRRWEGLQEQFLKLSSRAAWSIVRGSGHFIQRDDPQAVIAGIKSVVEEARTLRDNDSRAAAANQN